MSNYKKRNRISLKNKTIKSSNNIISFKKDPFVISNFDEKKEKQVDINFNNMLTEKNEQILLLFIKYIETIENIDRKKNTKGFLKPFFEFIHINEIISIKEIDSKKLIFFKHYIMSKYKNTTSRNAYYYAIVSFLKWLIVFDKNKLNQDIIEGDIPKGFLVTTKNSVEKDLENANKSYDQKKFANLIKNCSDSILNENIHYNYKIVSFMLIISYYTGLNKEVLFQFTNEDLLLLSQDFEYIEFSKIKNRKGAGCTIKVFLKNYKINNNKLSELARIILQEKNKKAQLFCTNDAKRLLFTAIKIRGGKEYNHFYDFSYTYQKMIKRTFKALKYNFTEHFSFNRCRKHYERFIFQCSENNLSLTSTLMGHSKGVAVTHYMNTAAPIKSHQKLALTQDIIKGFSKNKKTENFMVYQELLSLFNLNLEDAIKLSKSGFSLDEIIDIKGEEL
jgi:hypothetical protein